MYNKQQKFSVETKYFSIKNHDEYPFELWFCLILYKILYKIIGILLIKNCPHLSPEQLFTITCQCLWPRTMFSQSFIPETKDFDLQFLCWYYTLVLHKTTVFLRHFFEVSHFIIVCN